MFPWSWYDIYRYVIPIKCSKVEATPGFKILFGVQSDLCIWSKTVGIVGMREVTQSTTPFKKYLTLPDILSYLCLQETSYLIMPSLLFTVCFNKRFGSTRKSKKFELYRQKSFQIIALNHWHYQESYRSYSFSTVLW